MDFAISNDWIGYLAVRASDGFPMGIEIVPRSKWGSSLIAQHVLASWETIESTREPLARIYPEIGRKRYLIAAPGWA